MVYYFKFVEYYYVMLRYAPSYKVHYYLSNLYGLHVENLKFNLKLICIVVHLHRLFESFTRV